MKRVWKTITAVALFSLSLGLLAACASPYDSANCTGGRARCSSGVFGNYDSYNWWKTDQESN